MESISACTCAAGRCIVHSALHSEDDDEIGVPLPVLRREARDGRRARGRCRVVQPRVVRATRSSAGQLSADAQPSPRGDR